MGFSGTVQELKEMLADEDYLTEGLMERLALDERVAVKNIYRRLLAQQQKKIAEQKRLEQLFIWEKRLGSPQNPIAGVDEAGRGPLAGPVAAAAVILDPQVFLPGLNDSKKITPQMREKLAVLIKEKAIAWSLGWATVKEIDYYNIHNASFMAMKRAIAGLVVKPKQILVDGFDIPELVFPQISLQKGDSLSASIAAASIIAKVARDKVMAELDTQYPIYGFARHKGYPTKEHYNAIQLNGSSPVHRQTFKGVRD